MRTRRFLYALPILAAALTVCARPASAGLTVLEQDTGNVAATQDGCGSLTQACSINLSVPVGSTVVSAYLFSAYYNETGTPFHPSVTLDGSAVALGPNINNATACCGIGSAEANVTSLVAPIVNGGTGNYTFNIKEGGIENSSVGTDGEALVIVYSNPSIATSTVGILSGFASVTGDTTSINFATPLDPTAPGFTATMGIGDSFSCCNQESTITVDGQTLTTVAGNNDDNKDGGPASNGSLITVGGPNDGFTVASPGHPATDYATDHEYYNLAPFITKGDTAINVDTINASHDDNIFLATFDVSGLGGVNTPPPPPTTTPEPASYTMLGAGLLALFLMRKRIIATA